MPKNKITRSPMVAGFMAVAMGFHSPAGHDAVYQGLLHVWFAPQWLEAMRQSGTQMSFETFRSSDMAQIWVYHPDPEIFRKRMELLQRNVSFCLPSDEDNKGDKPYRSDFVACHAGVVRSDQKDKKSKQNGLACP